LVSLSATTEQFKLKVGLVFKEIWMFRISGLTLTLMLCVSPAFASNSLSPCRTHSREMTMVKNCYTGDMAHTFDNGGHFYQNTDPDAQGIGYCYNSLVFLEHHAGDAQVKIHVLKEGKAGDVRAYNYVIAPEEIKKIAQDAPAFMLNGLKGECYSSKGDKSQCKGGLLNAIGLQDVDRPMTLAIGRGANGHYVLSHIISNPNELDKHPAKPLEVTVDQDASKITSSLLQEIRYKLVQSAKSKMEQMRAPASTPQTLADKSVQFRYCTMALEGFLKEKNLPSPLQSEEKLSLNAVTTYMNNDPTAAPPPARSPATSKKRR
jgi:hypothetical protein